MTIRDLKNTLDVVHSLEPAVRATGTANGAVADLLGFNSAAVVVYFGAYTNGTHTPTLEHSDDGTTFVATVSTDLDGSFVAVSSAGGANTLQRVGYRGSKRYLRAVMTVASGATGAASAAAIIRGDAGSEPV